MALRVLLLGLNARYSHSNLAIKYLQMAAEDIASIDRVDYSINDDTDRILRLAHQGSYDLVGFSVYIWNVQIIKGLLPSLKKIIPSAKILLGGPEVSYESLNFMKENPAVDYLLAGEGECSFPKLLKALEEGDLQEVEGLYYRLGDRVFEPIKPPGSLDFQQIPILYETDRFIEENKYIYYEASRGCPYRCAFCLSSAQGRPRFRPVDQVLAELETFITEKVPLVKLVDRSFNANPHATQILRHLIEKGPGPTRFHLELHPMLLDEQMLAVLERAPKGLFQYEIGVQTTNPITAKKIQRAGSTEAIAELVNRLRSHQNAHIHLDLIAGLPYEDLSSFGNSFNDVYRMGPDKLQLGTLKLLKGSMLREKAGEYGILYQEHAPYELLSTRWLSYADLLVIKAVEDVVERFYNEGYFQKTLEYVLTYFSSPWVFYQALANWWVRRDLLYRNLSRVELYNLLFAFVEELGLDISMELVADLIRYDYFRLGNKKTTKLLVPKPETEALRLEQVYALLTAHPKISSLAKDADLRDWVKSGAMAWFFHRMDEQQPIEQWKREDTLLLMLPESMETSEGGQIVINITERKRRLDESDF